MSRIYIMMNGETRTIFFENFWRYLTNAWTIIFMAVVVIDFFSNRRLDYLFTPLSIMYGAILSLFVGTKEFDRWYDIRGARRHPGEVFVIVWSVLLFGMLIISWASHEQFSISSDIVSVYIMVLTVFALSQSSKRVYKSKRNGKITGNW